MNDNDEIAEGIEGTEEIQTSFRNAVQEKVSYQIGADKTFPDLHVTVGSGLNLDIEPSLPKGFDRLVFKPEMKLGLLYRSPVEVEKREVFKLGDKEVAFIDYWPNFKAIRYCYTKMGLNANDVITHVISLTKIPVSILKGMEVWGYLDEELKEQLGKIPETSTIESVDKMGHARKFRKARADYDGVQRIIRCMKCGHEQKMNPAIILKKAELAGKSHQDWCLDWKCQLCCPTPRGKKISAKYANMPRELICHHEGCKNVTKQHPGITEKAAKAKGIGFNEYIGSYMCKEHRIKKPHQFSAEGMAERKAKGLPPGRRGRIPNPVYAGIPHKAKCTGTCGKEITIVASQAIKKANVLGLTMDEFIKTFKCRACGGKITKSQKAEYLKRMKKTAKAAKLAK